MCLFYSIKMPQKKFVFLSHTADIKFQAFGKTIEKCFENSGLATAYSIFYGKVKNKKVKKIKVKGNDLRSLLYNFLDEIIYLFDAESFLVGGLKVKINKNILEAELNGDDAENYDKSKMDHIKSVTYSEMFVEKVDAGFVCQVVLDV